MILFFFIHRILLMTAATFGVWFCIARFGPAAGLGIWALAMLAACLGTAALLHTSEIGRITWKNRLSGYILPWGHSFRWGGLLAITLNSWIVWILIGLAVIIVTRNQSVPDRNPYIPPLDIRHALLLFTWFLFGSGIIYVMGNIKRNFQITSTSGRSMLKVVLIMTIFLGSSVVFQFIGDTTRALLLTGLPALIAFAIAALYLGAAMLLFRKGGHH